MNRAPEDMARDIMRANQFADAMIAAANHAEVTRVAQFILDRIAEDQTATPEGIALAAHRDSGATYLLAMTHVTATLAIPAFLPMAEVDARAAKMSLGIVLGIVMQHHAERAPMNQPAAGSA